MKFGIEIPTINLESYGVIFLISNVVAAICTLLVILSIIYDFIQYHRPTQNKRKVKSWIDTISMFAYFLIYTALLRPVYGWTCIDSLLLDVIQIIGMILLITGCFVNIKGRMMLKHNWANQATIYQDHTLVTESVYSWVRHPLYASLIWMFIGGSLIYCSHLSFFSIFLIFVPMMYRRAKLEEVLLETEFPEYLEYKQRTGMFFPKII